ncbi:hypothetical protein M8C21_022430 [Ambrosia artemisiifolia]|uniref:Uncharacterized protein n=1 Tax=Ambrosia artemisiifolia TaxID=4212 RepID=A0AAD5D087_AMBAR|nr:hypothetical protein M8C21_022430 [Ambrosia artemisiifolia]
MCPGHLIPMVDMAKLIAQHSVTVTIVITPRNAERYGAVLHRAIASGLPVKLLQLRFPASDYGLPEGCECVDDLPTFNLSKNFFDALAMLQKPLEDVFNELKPTPSCIISDKHLHWTADVAKKFRIPWVIFDGMSCFTQLASHNLCVSKIHEELTNSDPFVLPGLPDSIFMTKSQLPGLFNPGSSAKGKEMKSVRERVRATELGAYGTLINSFDELETRYIDEFKKLKQGRVWCIGPFSNSNKNDLDRAQRGSKDSINNHECMKWLDSQDNRSVIYACLGSLTRLTPLQFIELALGLEDSRYPFILVVKGGSKIEEIEKWLDESGYESRVKGRGVLIRRWAPQVLILSHREIGAFLTHCGWNSTVEGICAGVPMITWPQFADQFFNERLVVQVLGVGVGVGAQRVMHLEDEHDDEIQAKREDVCKAVKRVMDEEKEGEERRENAKYLKEMAAQAIEEGGSSQVNLNLFIEDIRLHTNKEMVPPSTDLHFVLFPLMAQGHMVPMVDIARILAQRGAIVTIIATPLVANRFRSIISRAIVAKLKIQLLEIQLPLAQVGLPKGCESIDAVLEASESPSKYFRATELLEQPAEDLLRGICPPPDCIIADFFVPWSTEVARKLNIPRLVFHGPGCFWLTCMHVVYSSNLLETIESDSEPFVLPGLPHRVEVAKFHIAASSKDDTMDQKAFLSRAIKAEKGAYGIVIHTFEELEREYVKEFTKVTNTKVWCIGPVMLCNKDVRDISERGNKAAINEHDCLKWLDKRESRSVFYVCLGSLAHVSTQQAIELGLGLESTYKPFIWCVRNKSEELETWFSKEGFEDRVRDRGLIIRGWAPQVLILSHQAIGGFLTHCGWNSTLESICTGVPVVTWPFFADQFLNETFIVEILKIGVRIGVKIPVLLGDEEKTEPLVKKEDVKRAVECLMEEDEEGEQRRTRVSELATMAKIAMDEGGSSYENVSSLIRDISETLGTKH